MILLGIVCLYCGFYDYSVVDASVNVTNWYWIYGAIIGGWVAVFILIESINLYCHHVRRMEYQTMEVEMEAAASVKQAPKLSKLSGTDSLSSSLLTNQL